MPQVVRAPIGQCIFDHIFRAVERRNVVDVVRVDVHRTAVHPVVRHPRCHVLQSLDARPYHHVVLQVFFGQGCKIPLAIRQVDVVVQDDIVDAPQALLLFRRAVLRHHVAQAHRSGHERPAGFGCRVESREILAQDVTQVVGTHQLVREPFEVQVVRRVPCALPEREPVDQLLAVRIPASRYQRSHLKEGLLEPVQFGLQFRDALQPFVPPFVGIPVHQLGVSFEFVQFVTRQAHADGQRVRQRP